MDVRILKREFRSGEGQGPDMERVEYIVETKYFTPVKDVMWVKPNTSDKYIRVAIKRYNMWRCFQPKSRVLDILFSLNRKQWKFGVKLCGF